MKAIIENRIVLIGIEFNEVELQALANFIGPTSVNDRIKKWRMSKEESETLSELYDLLYKHGINSTKEVYPLEN